MLFGHHNDDVNQGGVTTAPDPSDAGLNPLAVDPATGVSLPTAPPPPPPAAAASLDEPSVLNQPIATAVVDEMPETPAAPAPIADIMPAPGSSSFTPPNLSSAPAVLDNDMDQPDNTDAADSSSPADSYTDTPSSPATAPAAPEPTARPDTDAPVPEDLLALKQQALAELGPLVNQLDQTPEERFRTTMMLIQSTDDSSRIPEAYKAAQAITDEKVRAQALLDVVNEINYFTQSRQTAQATPAADQSEVAL